MISIYKKALDRSFQRLHPKLQEKFSLHSSHDQLIRAEGVMDEIWGEHALMTPFLRQAQGKHISFAERGTNVPFTLENVAYVDPFGREAVAWVRSFYFPDCCRRFDATMVYSEAKRCILDYVGIRQDWLTPLELNVLDDGSVEIKTNGQKRYMPLIHSFVRIPFLGQAIVNERYDDIDDCFRIKVVVRQKGFGTILGYRGSFAIQYEQIEKEQIPAYMYPQQYRREE